MSCTINNLKYTCYFQCFMCHVTGMDNDFHNTQEGCWKVWSLLVTCFIFVIASCTDFVPLSKSGSFPFFLFRQGSGALSAVYCPHPLFHRFCIIDQFCTFYYLILIFWLYISWYVLKMWASGNEFGGYVFVMSLLCFYYVFALGCVKFWGNHLRQLHIHDN